MHTRHLPVEDASPTVADDYISESLAPWAAGIPAVDRSPRANFERGLFWGVALVATGEVEAFGRPDLVDEALQLPRRIAGPMDGLATDAAAEEFKAGIAGL